MKIQNGIATIDLSYFSRMRNLIYLSVYCCYAVFEYHFTSAKICVILLKAFLESHLYLPESQN
jgi:hypothetical protein